MLKKMALLLLCYMVSSTILAASEPDFCYRGGCAGQQQHSDIQSTTEKNSNLTDTQSEKK